MTYCSRQPPCTEGSKKGRSVSVRVALENSNKWFAPKNTPKEEEPSWFKRQRISYVIKIAKQHNLEFGPFLCLPRVSWRSSFSEGATYKTWMSLNSIFMLLVWLFNPQCLAAAAPLLTPRCLWRPGWSTRVGLGSLGSDSTPYRWTCGSAYPRMCQNSAQWWALAVVNNRLWIVKSKLYKRKEKYNVQYLCLLGIVIKGNR